MAVADEVRRLLAGSGDPERAAGQQAYMRSAMPYRGLTSPQLRTLLRPVLRTYRPASREDWEADVRDLWDRATHREEWYAAIALAKVRPARPWRDSGVLPLCRHLVTTGAWWDVVDDVATHVVRDALDADPAEVTPTLRAWMHDDDPWLRRTSLVCQVGRKDRIDLDLLAAAVEANLDDPSFWLRKAIGWGLRDAARTHPDWVRDLVATHDNRISGLSRREALKHLPPRPATQRPV